MSPYRRFVNNTVTTTILLAFVAMLALQPRAATAQQTKPAASSGFSFVAYGDSRPMTYLPLKEGQPDASKLFVEMFGLASRHLCRTLPASISIRMSPPVSPLGNTSTKCSLSRLSPSHSRRRAQPCTS